MVFSSGSREGDDSCLPLQLSFCTEIERASLSVTRRVRKLLPQIFSRVRTVVNRLAVLCLRSVKVASLDVDQILMASSVSEKNIKKMINYFLNEAIKEPQF